MMISKANGELVNCVAIMYFQLVKELIIWEKCKNKMIKGIAKRKPKNDVCHFAIILENLFQKWFPLNGA
jgi:hypothetical protein